MQTGKVTLGGRDQLTPKPESVLYLLFFFLWIVGAWPVLSAWEFGPKAQ